MLCSRYKPWRGRWWSSVVFVDLCQLHVVCTSTLSIVKRCLYVDIERLQVLSVYRLVHRFRLSSNVVWASTLSVFKQNWVVLMFCYHHHHHHRHHPRLFVCVFLCFKTNNEWFIIHYIVLNSLLIHINNNTHYNIYVNTDSDVQ